MSASSLPGASRLLAIGDGMHTDIKGANVAGIDALFIADGVHGEEIDAVTSEHLGVLFGKRRSSCQGGNARACVVRPLRR